MSEGFKKCPFCNRMILGTATECKHCGASLGGGGSTNSGSASRNTYVNSNIDDNDADYSGYSGDTGFSFGNAFTYMFKDSNFIMKFVSLVIAVFVMDVFRETSQMTKGAPMLNPAQAGFTLLAVLAITSVVLGYIVSSVRNVSEKGAVPPMLGVRVFSSFITGIICLISNFLALLAVILLVFFILFTRQTGLSAFILFGIVILLIIGYMCFSTAFLWMFSNKRNPLTFFRYILAGRLIIESGIGRYALTCLCMFGVNVVIGIALGIFGAMLGLANTNVPMWCILIMTSVVVAYGVLVNTYFIGKSINANLVDEL